MSRRKWSVPDETLGNKAFSFGIFNGRFPERLHHQWLG